MMNKLLQFQSTAKGQGEDFSYKREVNLRGKMKNALIHHLYKKIGKFRKM